MQQGFEVIPLNKNSIHNVHRLNSKYNGPAQLSKIDIPFKSISAISETQKSESISYLTAEEILTSRQKNKHWDLGQTFLKHVHLGQ